jgi:hypothetical protein
MAVLNKALTLVFCGLAGVLTLSAQAATPAAPAPSSPAGWQNPQPMGGPMPPMCLPFPGGRPMMHFEPASCHGGELFCASVLSDNPGDTIQKLNSILPSAAKGVHYQVRVSVVAVPDQPTGQTPGDHQPPAAG